MRKWHSACRGGLILVTALAGCDSGQAPIVEPKDRLAFAKQSSKYLAGLDETVTVVKGLGDGYVLRASGEAQPLREVLAADREAWRDAHGALSPKLVGEIEPMSGSALVDVALLFDPLDDWTDYLAAFDSGDPAELGAQAEIMTQAIAAHNAAIASQLDALGITDYQIDPNAPFISARIPKLSLALVAQIPELTSVVPNGETEPVEESNDIVDPLVFHHRSALSTYTGGATRRIAILEPGVCRVRADHVMIDAAVSYSHAGVSCVTASDCTAKCGTANVPNACIGNRCLDGHGNATTSVVTRFAPDSPIYYPNGGSAPNGPTCSKDLAPAFSYLQANAVRWVNQSFSCSDNPGGLSALDGRVQDYYARAYNYVITKSAGNDGAGSEACENTWNSICVGSVDAEGEVSCFSSRDNPLRYTSGALDREEPDVMAYGGQLNCPSGEVDTLALASPSSTSSVTYSSGTSFAAPTILGMSVLLDEYCAAQNKVLTSVSHRAILRSAGYASNPDGWKYSTPKPSTDHVDGGGIAFLDVTKRWCNPTQDPNDEHGLVQGTVRPSADGTAAPLPSTDPSYPDTPPQSTPQDQGLHPNSSLTGYRWKDLWAGQPRVFTAGTRVRVTFSWEACVLSPDPVANLSVATDYDLFLFNSTLGQGLYASQSNDDVNEGFDVIIPAGWDGDYDLILIWPDGSTGCGGAERTSTAWWIKKP